MRLNFVIFVNEELGEINETRGDSDRPFLIGKIGVDPASHFENIPPEIVYQSSGLLNVIVLINSCQN